VRIQNFNLFAVDFKHINTFPPKANTAITSICRLFYIVAEELAADRDWRTAS
jgi:hypothetical protein